MLMRSFSLAGLLELLIPWCTIWLQRTPRPSMSWSGSAQAAYLVSIFIPFSLLCRCYVCVCICGNFHN
ncbi:hypothetical protein FGIG_11433 [Fasciola gigantica]|uniref:Uncharacterized protein n=1 Tax=Fasciola gigantica TaxID=46835 RepID=A0A504YF38_FASGI|nr:hypothetical protein FGIG_11433 [Fasciola gigantica]